jgi:hypothetical protein
MPPITSVRGGDRGERAARDFDWPLPPSLRSSRPFPLLRVYFDDYLYLLSK